LFIADNDVYQPCYQSTVLYTQLQQRCLTVTNSSYVRDCR